MSVHYRKLVSNPLLHACQNAPGKNINKFTVIISRYPKKIKYRRLPVHKWRINRDTIRRWIRLLQSLRPKVWGLYLQDLTHSPSARSFGLSVCSYISGLLLVQSFSAYRLRSSSLVAQIYTFAPQTFSDFKVSIFFYKVSISNFTPSPWLIYIQAVPRLVTISIQESICRIGIYIR